MFGVEASAEQIDAFRAALRQQLEGIDRADLIAILGVTRAALQKWLAGESEPARAKVFALEEALDVPPGALSAHLGYLPTTARDLRTTVEAIERDTALTRRDRQLLVDLYRSRLDG